MKKAIVIAVLALALTGAGIAQDRPQAEFFGGYSFLHTSESGIDTNGNGVSGSFSFNPTAPVGLVADFGYYHASPNVSSLLGPIPLSTDISVNTFSYLFGPKYAIRTHEKVTPFVQALFGGAHQSTSFSISGISGSGSENAFAMALGGGLDMKATSNVAIRLIQAEYVLSKFNDGGNNRQNSIRLSAGVVFRFGEH